MALRTTQTEYRYQKSINHLNTAISKKKYLKTFKTKETKFISLNKSTNERDPA